MIRLHDVSIIFSGKPLFSGISWQITEGARIGLIGVNGSGKSTLLKIMASQQDIDSGYVETAKNFSVGYLPQELHGTSTKTVFDEALMGCGTTRETQLALEAVEQALQTTDHETEEYAELVIEHGRLQHLFQQLDGFSLESRTARVLEGLRVPQDWWQNPLNTLSGGWQMRIHLAKLILRSPSLLLLDEPTNHLDLEAILWLSNFLKTYEGGLVLISHDRYFLDENVKQVVELWNSKLHFYAGNYSYYRTEKENRLELLRNSFQNQQDSMARTQQFIERFRYKATKARQVQSRVKMLEKIDKIELPDDSAQIHLRIPAAPRSGRFVLEAKALSHSYNEKPVFNDVNFQMERGEKVSLVGINGAGKTTLLKILAGVMPQAQGELKVGHNVFPAYYAQLVTDQLDLKKTILEEIRNTAPELDETQLRTVLGSFLFTGDSVYKKISVLSGGEKSRVALAKILLRPSNLLLLDEPTNHLDLTSKEILLRALQNYEGAILFISHDRFFMDQLSQKVFELKEGTLSVFLGNYSEYSEKITAEAKLEALQPKKHKAEAFYKSKGQKKREAEIRQQFSKVRKEIFEPLALVESGIATHEARLQQLEALLSDNDVCGRPTEYQKYLQEYNSIKTQLKPLYAQWESLQKRKEEFEASQENAIITNSLTSKNIL